MQHSQDLETRYRCLVEREYRFVYRLLFWLCGDAATAEDLTQEAFVRAWKALPGRRAGGESDRAWLAAIARSAAADHARKRRVPQGPLEAAAGIPDPCRSPETAATDAETQGRLLRAVLALPEPYRSALALTHLEELSAAEAARVLRVPQGTVRWRVSRALRLLRERLGPGNEVTEQEIRNVRTQYQPE